LLLLFAAFVQQLHHVKAQTQIAEPYETLFALDCNAHAHFMPDHSFLSSSVAVSGLSTAYDFVMELVLSRARCRCPGLADAALQQYFGANMTSLLRALQDPNPAYASELLNTLCADGQSFRNSMADMQELFGLDSFPGLWLYVCACSRVCE